MAGDAL